MDKDQTQRSDIAGVTYGGPYALAVMMGASVRRWSLPETGITLIGREAPASILLIDDSVSRKHARIYGGSPPEIEDLGSTNGTKVMGRRLATGERVPLPHGTVVELGSIAAVVQRGDLGADGASSDSTREDSRRDAITGSRSTVALRIADRTPPVVQDATMRQLYQLVDVIAPSKLSVLVLGETGVGKDVFAETIHRRSPRGVFPFLRLNCAALPENLLEAELFGYERGAFTGATQTKPGLFESADGGTVFLDEIGEMPLSTQAKLLRVLESGEVLRLGSLKSKRVDVRFVSATNRDLEALSSIGQFRSDLYFRLNGVGVLLPPLRKRPDDLPVLAQHFLAAARPNIPAEIDPSAIERLRAYRWPGNIRELKNVIERSALLAQNGPIRIEHIQFGSTLFGNASDVEPAVSVRESEPSLPGSAMRLPASGNSPLLMRDQVAEVEKEKILEAMDRCGGNQSRAAKLLGISRTTLIKRLEAYGYNRPRKGHE